MDFPDFLISQEPDMLLGEMEGIAAWTILCAICEGFIDLLNSPQAMRHMFRISVAFSSIAVKRIALCDKLKACWAAACPGVIEKMVVFSKETSFSSDAFIVSSSLPDNKEIVRVQSFSSLGPRVLVIFTDIFVIVRSMDQYGKSLFLDRWSPFEDT